MAKDLAFDREGISLCDVLDRALNSGVVVAGDIVISVAGVDLIYLNLQLLLTSVETASGLKLTGEPARAD
ncbi:MAG: gas vesicle protein [Chitinivibrionia bacterium]|nr:gas vesicle protein [Chitinivibrionia bacterium]